MYSKRSKSIRKRQMPYDFIHMWNLRNKTDEHMGSGEGGKRRDRNKPQETLNDRGQTMG